jgi:hypothetical protein
LNDARRLRDPIQDESHVGETGAQALDGGEDMDLENTHPAWHK